MAAQQHDREGLGDDEWKSQAAQTMDAFAVEALRLWFEDVVETESDGALTMDPDRWTVLVGPCDTDLELRVPRSMVDQLNVLADRFEHPRDRTLRATANRFVAEAIAFWWRNAAVVDPGGRATVRPDRRRPNEDDPSDS